MSKCVFASVYVKVCVCALERKILIFTSRKLMKGKESNKTGKIK